MKVTNRSAETSGGVGLFGWMFLIFLTLKLLDKIDWSWWWVTAPLWVPLAVGAALLTIMASIAISAEALDYHSNKKIRKRAAERRRQLPRKGRK